MTRRIFLQASIYLLAIITIETALIAGKDNSPIPHGAKVGQSRFIQPGSTKVSWQCPYKNCNYPSESLENLIAHCDTRHYHLHFMVCTDPKTGQIINVTDQHKSLSAIQAEAAELINANSPVCINIVIDNTRLICLGEKIHGTRDNDVLHPTCIRKSPLTALQHYQSLIHRDKRPIPPHRASSNSDDGTPAQLTNFRDLLADHDSQLSQSTIPMPQQLYPETEIIQVNASLLQQSIDNSDLELSRPQEETDFTPPTTNISALFL